MRTKYIIKFSGEPTAYLVNYNSPDRPENTNLLCCVDSHRDPRDAKWFDFTGDAETMLKIIFEDFPYTNKVFSIESIYISDNYWR